MLILIEMFPQKAKAVFRMIETLFRLFNSTWYLKTENNTVLADANIFWFCDHCPKLTVWMILELSYFTLIQQLNRIGIQIWFQLKLFLLKYNIVEAEAWNSQKNGYTFIWKI